MRPDPDALLLQTKREDSKQGRLKLFFGFAPGVGKTYAMLESARRLRAEGKDVVIGCVETHGRAETAALVDGLEEVPRRELVHRGVKLYELDTSGVIARRPAIVLVDELAHTNAPDGIHKKRWQDVLDLLDAGIDVYTTLNVQHVASLNDVVAQMTHVQVKETVPDAVLDRADEIELVDISPDDLIARLRSGKVYLGEQAGRAAEHFFKRGNLLALRELALRRTADRVDSDVRTYKRAHGLDFSGAERLLVCIGPGPGSERLIRAARRIAAGLRAPWSAVFVETPQTTVMSPRDRERLEAHLRLAESLGAGAVQLSGVSVAQTLLQHARKTDVTRLIIGKPARSRLRRSIVDELVRDSGPIDVLVTTGDEGASVQAVVRQRQSGWTFSALGVAAATLAGFGLERFLSLTDVVMLYFAAIIVVSMFVGAGPSLLTAALSVLAFDFFFVPPKYTFAVSDVRHVLTFGMMFAVSALLSQLMLRLRRQERFAREREERTAALYALGQEMAVAMSDRQVATSAAAAMSRALSRPCGILLADMTFVGAPIAERDVAVAKWVLDHDRAAGAETDTLPGAAVTCFPLSVTIQTIGVLAVSPPLDTEQRQFIGAACRQVALALERWQLADEANRAELAARTEELRNTLLASVSHDLRTPLASIAGAASALSTQVLADEKRKELLAAIVEEALALEHTVANLLVMTRYESGGITLNREWVSVDELCETALARIERFKGRQPVRVNVPETVALHVDVALFEQLLVNVIDNGLKHGNVTIEAEKGVLRVRDDGPGFAPGTEGRVFDKFFRAEGGRGAGLGLALAKAIVSLHGGEIRAENDHGGVITVTLP